ncbi:tape measure protein [Metasolibacillus meyeri]|uniref:tape measure protein n=1 Tax=Metasolibacillus meyeri TaxID=1071052 RepID=UPI000D301684|nr:tape measure protein [Metasolibacillus meyeri]
MATLQNAIQISNLTVQMTQINMIFNQINNQAQDSVTLIDTIAGKITGLAGKLLSLENAKIVIGLSDDMASTQGRLELMNSEYQKQAQAAGTINTALTSTSALQDMIFDSAQRTFSSYQTTADMVTRLGTEAANAFSSPTEIVAFTEQMNKAFAIAGTPPEAMSKITQAMATGGLNGVGFDNLLKDAPVAVGNIQKYLEEVMNIDASNIKQLATEGVITADVIKNAMFYAAEDTNAAFASMPTTWRNIWQNIQTKALQAFSPILLKINEIANSEKIQQMIFGIGMAIELVAGWVMMLMDLLIAVGSFIYDNWSLIAPIIGTITAAIVAYTIALGVLKVAEMISAFWKVINTTATLIYAAAMGAGTGATWSMIAATWGLNSALAANPIFIIIMLVIILIGFIYAAVAAFNHFAGTSVSATGIIVGAFAVAGAFIMNVLFGIAEIAFGVIEGLYNHWMAFANFFANVFNDPVGAIIHLFGDFGDNILGVIEKIAAALDFVFGTNFASTVAGWRNGLANLTNWAAEEYGNGNYEKLYDELDINKTLEELGLKVERFNYGDTWDSSYNWGANLFKSKDKEKDNSVEEAINNALAFGENNALALDDTMNKGNEHSKQIADNTGSMANGVTLMNDELKYMRDLAEREAINRYTTAEVIVDARSENHINSELDIDGVIDRFGEKVEEVAVGLAEGGGVSFV